MHLTKVGAMNFINRNAGVCMNEKILIVDDEKEIADKDKRNSVMSVIAYSLCASFMCEKKILTEVYDTIYRDISGKTRKRFT